MPGDSPNSGRTLTGLRVAGHDGAGQFMLQPVRETLPGGAVIMQVLVQRRRYRVLDGGGHGMGCHPCAEALSETRGAATPFPARAAYLRDPRTRRHATQSTLADSGVLPVFYIRVASLGFSGIRNRDGQHRSEEH